jgi:hypothetical protein
LVRFVFINYYINLRELRENYYLYFLPRFFKYNWREPGSNLSFAKLYFHKICISFSYPLPVFLFLLLLFFLICHKCVMFDGVLFLERKNRKWGEKIISLFNSKIEIYTKNVMLLYLKNAYDIKFHFPIRVCALVPPCRILFSFTWIEYNVNNKLKKKHHILLMIFFSVFFFYFGYIHYSNNTCF